MARCLVVTVLAALLAGCSSRPRKTEEPKVEKPNSSAVEALALGMFVEGLERGTVKGEVAVYGQGERLPDSMVVIAELRGKALRELTQRRDATPPALALLPASAALRNIRQWAGDQGGRAVHLVNLPRSEMWKLGDPAKVETVTAVAMRPMER